MNDTDGPCDQRKQAVWQNRDMEILRRNYDLAVTAGTGAVLLALDTTIGIPWPLWAVYGAIVVAQIRNRMARGWSR
ncbi:hypothetical protein [Mycobacterium sp. 155]|uniref:hypothetical protein n=1 Tax=Mycobacterium sp. 155 TaxID=1157943 RepID=UPI0012FAAC9D|nr:hypothetical protein [Mycobacterium sp. 155]